VREEGLCFGELSLKSVIVDLKRETKVGLVVQSNGAALRRHLSEHPSASLEHISTLINLD
jgi:hypothetical protein